MKRKNRKYVIMTLIGYLLLFIDFKQVSASPAATATDAGRLTGKALPAGEFISTNGHTSTQKLMFTIECIITSVNAVPELVNVSTGVDLITDSSGKATFEAPELKRLNQAGEPQIPWQEITLLLPPATDLKTIRIEITDSASRLIPEVKEIVPTPPLATWYNGQMLEKWPADKNLVDGRDMDIYASNAFWPALQVKSVRTSRIKQWKMVAFSLPLFSYNARAAELKQWEKIRVTLTIAPEAPASQQQSAVDPGSPVTSVPGLLPDEFRDRERIKKLVFNYQEALPAYKKLMHKQKQKQKQNQKQEPGGNETSLSYGTGEQMAGEENYTLTYSTAEPLSTDFLSLSPAPAVDVPGYAIITTSAIHYQSGALNAFITHKQARGFNVILVTEEHFYGGIGDQASEQIRSWLQNHYIPHNIKYVLLIGDPNPVSGDIPMKMLWPLGSGQPEMRAPSDYYYADLTGNWDLDGDGFPGEERDDFGILGIDYSWDVLVGRIPFYGSIQELDKILYKIIVYENQSRQTSLWRDNILLINKPMDAVTPGWQLGEAIKDNVLIPYNFSYHRIYDDHYTLPSPPETMPVTYENVKSVWSGSSKTSEGKYGLVVFSTHGWIEGGAGVISTQQVPYLNDQYPGITFQAACDTAYPEAATNLAYALLLNGGIGSIGASRYSWYYIGETYFPGSPSHFGVAYEFTKRLAGEQMSVGEALYDTKQNLAPGIWANMVVFNLYGDPSLYLPQLRLLRVDLGEAAQAVDSKWTAWSEPEAQQQAVQNFTALGGVSITLNSSSLSSTLPIDWYTGTSNMKPADPLLQDGIKITENLEMSLSGLQAGKYEMRTYHYYPDQSVGTIDIFVKEQQNTAYRQVVDEQVIANSISDYPPAAISRFEFLANGSEVIAVKLAAGDQQGELVINGFALSYKEALLLTSRPSTVNFNDVPLGETRTQNMTLFNRSAQSLYIESLVLNDPRFSLSPLNLPMTLVAGSSISFDVFFTPQQSGSFTGTLTVYIDSQNNPALVIELSATSSAPVNTQPPQEPPPHQITTYLDARFESGLDGFTYLDDAFRSTANPGYASGNRVAGAGYAGTGGLQLTLGGLDYKQTFGISGGFSTTFRLEQEERLSIAFFYVLEMNQAYEADEYSQVLLKVNDTYLGTNGHGYIEQLADGGTTGWKHIVIRDVVLPPGNHTLTLGGYNNKKTEYSESSRIYFDNLVVMTDTGTASGGSASE